MSNLQIACCFHPTTVLLVDDNRKFLTNLATDLSLKKIAYQLYDKPLQAISFLTETYKANPFTKRCLLRPEEQHKDHRSIDVNVSAIIQEVENEDRFKEIAVIVVDFAMPGLNGLEFCKQLKGKPFKIILLTGEADEKIAIDLFNNGLINKFIRKDMDGLYTLACSNPNTIVEKPMLYEVELLSAAPVIWARRKDTA